MCRIVLRKTFFQIDNNRVCGKTMENIRKRVDVRLVTSQKKLSKLVSKPTVRYSMRIW